MNDIQLLDCTLRDGGYVNDWKFGYANLASIFERLIDSKVDIIEIGFLDQRRPFDINRSIMPSSKCADKLYGALDKKNTMLVGMIDYGACDIENLSKCNDSCLDGIRVIFKKHVMYEAMEFCRKIKKLGYKVFSQLVSISSYTDEELMELVELVNDVKPYAVSMVDTYGLLYPDDMMHYYKILDKYVDNNIRIGFHAHNNLQLAYANSLSFLKMEYAHDIIVDGTLFGMGKSAGNAPIELLAKSLNEKYRKSYRIDSMLEAIEESVKDFYLNTPWGYKTYFYLCAKNKCHPNYVSFYEKKLNLSISKVDELLSLIEPNEKKLLYDKIVAEQNYKLYIEDKVLENESINAFRKEIGLKILLVIGPGKNLDLQSEVVKKFINSHDTYIISINFIPNDIDVNCVYITNGKRYHEMAAKLNKKNIKTLATSNLECRNGEFDFVVNRAPLLEREEKIIDNSFLMLIELLKKMNIKDISCAGFDGYSDKEDNYCNPSMEYGFVKHEAANLNSHIKKCISEFREEMNINFITFSSYDIEEDINGAAI